MNRKVRGGRPDAPLRDLPDHPVMARQLIVHLDHDSPPAGRVIAADGSSTSFAGWTELAQALSPESNPDDEAPAGPAPSG